jgi:hypothetical protein
VTLRRFLTTVYRKLSIALMKSQVSQVQLVCGTRREDRRVELLAGAPVSLTLPPIWRSGALGAAGMHAPKCLDACTPGFPVPVALETAHKLIYVVACCMYFPCSELWPWLLQAERQKEGQEPE